jgi:metal-responsive CopG/Arc/MetJ family transcriptional regulator
LRLAKEVFRVSKILPPAEGETTQFGIRAPISLVERLDAVAKESGHSRTDVVLHFLRWALQEYESEKKAKR